MTESELRFEEGGALFVVRTDRGAYADALRQLAFQDADGEFTRPFAPDAPDLERIYRRFSNTLELLLRQTARLAPTPWDASRLGELLDDALIHPLVHAPGSWIADWFGRAFLHCRIEWVAGVRPEADEEFPTETGPTAAASLETVEWEDHAINVTPLDIQLDVNERRGLDDRVEKIHRLLSPS